MLRWYNIMKAGHSRPNKQFLHVKQFVETKVVHIKQQQVRKKRHDHRSFLPAAIRLYNCPLWILNHQFTTGPLVQYFLYSSVNVFYSTPTFIEMLNMFVFCDALLLLSPFFLSCTVNAAEIRQIFPSAVINKVFFFLFFWLVNQNQPQQNRANHVLHFRANLTEGARHH